MSLYLGANYAPQEWGEERWSTDIKLMKEAGLSILRVGHLCWDSFETEEGVYTFEWFDRFIDMAADAGIKLFLDISTRPAPRWVHKLCPGCNITGLSGNVHPSLRRYMEDTSDEGFQKYALRFAKILVNRYKNHRALFGFGLCNELGGGHISYSEENRQRFVCWLKKKYKTVDNLNRSWGTSWWSRKLNSFDDAQLQENEVGRGAPEAWLDMRRFLSDGIGEYITKLSKVVAENAPGVPHSSNHFYGQKTLGFDYLKYSDQFVDYPGVGHYPGYDTMHKFQYCRMMNQTRITETGKPIWGLEFQAGRDGTFAGPYGSTRMQALLAIMNRTQMLIGWIWRSYPHGEEQFIHGLLGHDGIPTPNYYEYKQIAADFKKLERYNFPYLPKPDIAVAYSMESRWVNQYHPKQFKLDYNEGVINVQKVFFETNQEYNIVDLRHLKNKYKLLIVPGHILMENAAADTIRAFVKEGGTVIMTGYSANVDENCRVFTTPKPGYLDDVFGLRVAGFNRTDMAYYTENVINKTSQHDILNIKRNGSDIDIDADYYEYLELRGAKPYAEFAKPQRSKNDTMYLAHKATDSISDNTSLTSDHKKIIPEYHCAISVNQYGKGNAYYVAVESNKDILKWLIEDLNVQLDLEKGFSLPLGIQARRIADNQYYYVNTTKEDVEIPLERSGHGVLSDRDYYDNMILRAYDAELIVG